MASHLADKIAVAPVSGDDDTRAFIDLAYELNRVDPNWVPPLRREVAELLNPAKNPFFDHADVQLFLARRGARVVGRISAHIDHLALAMPVEQGMGPGTGNWGMLEAADQAVAAALIAAAESWLRARGMHRVLAPLSLSIWDEPGLLVRGHDHPPTVMMGHHPPQYQDWIEADSYRPAKSLVTYELNITERFPALIERLVAAGEKNSRIVVREVRLADFDREAATILEILNDAWSGNWGFVPITDREIAYAGKKLRPLVKPDLIRIAELDGEPVAFMMTLPDANQVIRKIGGKLFPFGWFRLLWWLHRPTNADMRVPLMGVRQRLQGSRLASQLAFMLIEHTRRAAVRHYGSTRSEIGWILDDNQGMLAIAHALNTRINREYVIYDKLL